ncbi:MAG: phosphotransferase [Propionibacteriaceae bacterium]|nr:phosphotransferase [Propionibacteriaceae bacterium]
MNSIATLCREIASSPVTSQREIASRLDCSLGRAHSLITEAMARSYVRHANGGYELTDTGHVWLDQFKVDNAIILAAGFGSRFVPFTYDTPKGLMKVKGTPMIERQIEQLHAAGVTSIQVVVGYLKEKFEYLTDKYGVTLVFNPEYATKNNMASLYHARGYLGNTYILVADNWIENSLFHAWEPDSWLSCVFFDQPADEWKVNLGSYGRITKMEIGLTSGWAMIGPAHFTREFSQTYVPMLEAYYHRPGTQDFYWEHIVKENLKSLPIHINKQATGNVYEFESFEDLRRYDATYMMNSNNEALATIETVFGVSQAEITGIRPLQGGLTNLSFVFECQGTAYVYRLPGAGSDKLIDRHDEKATYDLIAGLDIADEIYYFDPESGVKISRFYSDVRVSNAESEDDVRDSMRLLKTIHDAGITPDHRFDIEERIAYYETLAQDMDAITFADYPKVRAKADELLAFRRALDVPEVLCHIDYIYANILRVPDGSIRVIDWEYSGAADPLIDIAMYGIFAYYTKAQIDRALRYYLDREPTAREEARTYLYVALGGFVWSIWCEYKQACGDEFGDYSVTMYRYMKEYYRILKDGGYLDECVDSH